MPVIPSTPSNYHPQASHQVKKHTREGKHLILKGRCTKLLGTMSSDEDEAGTQEQNRDIIAVVPAAAAAAPLGALTEVWDCKKVKMVTDSDGKRVWTCDWCPLLPGQLATKPLAGWNATKALWHVCKISGMGVRPCKGTIPPEFARRYRDLYACKTLNSEQREASREQMSTAIDDMQERVVASLHGRQGGTAQVAMSPAAAVTQHASRKRPPEMQCIESSSNSTAISSISSAFSVAPTIRKSRKKQQQMTLCGTKSDPDAAEKMDVALADMIHSNLLPFRFVEDMKLEKILDIARTLPPNYKPPNRNQISGTFLDHLYDTNWKDAMATLLKESRDFGVTVFGDGATIVRNPLVNILAAGVNNPVAMLDIVDCSGHCAEGNKKDAQYICRSCSAFDCKDGKAGG